MVFIPRVIFLLSFYSVFFLGDIGEASQVKVPRLVAPVMDQSGLLQRSTVRRLNIFLQQVKKETGTQVAVLIIPNLEEDPIETLSLRVLDQWKLGSKEKDNGVLLLIAKKDRKIRVEVGQGLEGNLTDVYSRRVVEDVMAPYFRQSQYDSGVMAGVVQILRYAHPDMDWKSFSGRTTKARVSSSKEGKFSWLKLILLLFVIVMSIVSPSFRMLLFMSFLGGGRRGGGSGMGGGFSGGGGGFSGGGATGGW